MEGEAGTWVWEEDVLKDEDAWKEEDGEGLGGSGFDAAVAR